MGVGSSVHNLERCLVCDNLAKVDHLDKSFYGHIDHPLGHMAFEY